MYNFGLNSDQQALKATLRRYLENECPMALTREIINSPNRYSEKSWRELSELGFIGLGIPEAHGGSALTCPDIVAMSEELGRTVLPAPYIETLTVADLIARAGSDEQKSRLLADISAGHCVASFAADEPEAYWNAGRPQTTATRSGERYVLAGRKMWVPFAHVADIVICPVRMVSDGDHIGLVALRAKRLGARIRILDTIDDAYPLCSLTLDDLIVGEADFIGRPEDVADHWQRTMQLATLLSSAQLIGGIERCLEMLVGFSKERSQFGKLIGSYQAIKHRCADILTALEAARGSVYYAAWAMQEDADDLEIAISSAKAFASDAAVRSAETCLQSFGAIGFTWEHDIHFYLKRAKRVEMSLGDAAFQRERIAALILDSH